LGIRRIRGASVKKFVRRAFRLMAAAMIETAVSTVRTQGHITPRQLAAVQMGSQILQNSEDTEHKLFYDV
jgi:hypothetical protein